VVEVRQVEEMKVEGGGNIPLYFLLFGVVIIGGIFLYKRTSKRAE
jgi:hypothetical protein